MAAMNAIDHSKLSLNCMQLICFNKSGPNTLKASDG